MSESNDSNAVEVDNIRFETVMPERVLQIPSNQPGAKTQVQFEVRITNNTTTPRRFLLFAARPEFLQANKQKIPPRVSAFRTETPELSDFQFVMPGENITFLVEGYFQWFKNELKFVFLRKDATYWWFSNFKPGNCLIQVLYENPYPAWQVVGYTGEIIYLKPMYQQNIYNYPKSEMIEIEDVWIGEVSTPPIEFRLIQQ